MKQDITNQLLPIKTFVTRYAVIIFVFSVVSVFTFLTLQIANYANMEPTAAQQAERMSSLSSVKLDENSINKIRQLQDRNINIESLFDNGRANPFE